MSIEQVKGKTRHPLTYRPLVNPYMQKLLDQFLPVVAERNLLEHQNRSISMRGRNKERKRKEEMWSINLGALSQFILTFLLAGKSKVR